MESEIQISLCKLQFESLPKRGALKSALQLVEYLGRTSLILKSDSDLFCAVIATVSICLDLLISDCLLVDQPLHIITN